MPTARAPSRNATGKPSGAQAASVPRAVTVFEVGARDGLQNESREVSTALKKKLIRGLVEAGVREFELGAFVRPDRIPQMADTERLYKDLSAGKLKLGKARPWALVPNMRGLERAAEVGAKNIAVFTAATDGFATRNIGKTVSESLREYAQVVAEARRLGMKVRGYVSTAFACPFDGKVPPARALRVIERLAEMGVFQVSIGDTIGCATPKDVDQVIRPAIRMLGPEKTAVHFHDTRGTALANTLRSMEHGVKVVDSSAGGLGGCPFAPGATGNLATEDLIYMLEGMGIRTGIDLEKLARTSLQFAVAIGRPLSSRYVQAFATGCGALGRRALAAGTAGGGA